LHPEVVDFVFTDVVEGQGAAAAALSVGKFLEHLNELESGPSRKHSRKADHAALQTLAVRRITQEVRARMSSLVAIAAEPAPVPVEDTTTPELRKNALIALHAWLIDWQECAKSVITRRDLLIRLGIGKRRARKQAIVTPPAPPVVAEPVARPQQPTATIVAMQNGVGGR
jgi:hypothetical protein